MNPFKERSWNPYAAGALAGVLIIASVWFEGRLFGASASFVRTAGLLEKVFSPERVASMDYFVRYVPKIDWQWMFVAGIFVGALLSSALSGDFRATSVPPMWKIRFGSSVSKRAVVAVLGGVLIMFGSRLAGG